MLMVIKLGERSHRQIQNIILLNQDYASIYNKIQEYKSQHELIYCQLCSYYS